MREVEMIYRRLFEACGTCRLQDEILELFKDMKRNKIEPDKITFCTYYQAFLVSKK
jgi:pentatricopeptide repeat protein